MTQPTHDPNHTQPDTASNPQANNPQTPSRSGFLDVDDWQRIEGLFGNAVGYQRASYADLAAAAQAVAQSYIAATPTWESDPAMQTVIEALWVIQGLIERAGQRVAAHSVVPATTHA